MRRIDGGPAFPDQAGLASTGMSLRDYFAAAALTGMIASNSFSGDSSQAQQAMIAYVKADAMIKERSRGKN